MPQHQRINLTESGHSRLLVLRTTAVSRKALACRLATLAPPADRTLICGKLQARTTLNKPDSCVTLGAEIAGERDGGAERRTPLPICALAAMS